MFPLTRTSKTPIVAAFMNAAMTTKPLTRVIAGVVIAPRGRRMSWQVANYRLITGGQEGQG